MKLLSTLAFAAVAPAFASTVTVTYTGKVASITYADCKTFVNSSCSAWDFSTIMTAHGPGPADAQVSTGEAFSGSFVYDAGALLSGLPSDGRQAVYLNAVNKALFAAPHLSLPSAALPASERGSVSVIDNRNGSDAFFIAQSFFSPQWFGQASLYLGDSTATVFNSFELPTNLQPASFNTNLFQVVLLYRPDGDQIHVRGSLTSLSFASAVPEPSTWAMSLMGGLVAGAVWRRRSARVALTGAR
jgi:PEP-CTERM motif